MARLDRYTPEICSHLRHIAEQRNWHAWDKSVRSEELLEEVELTYHLHAAAQATGARAGFPAMPDFPIPFIDSEGALDPAKFVTSFYSRRNASIPFNRSDNGPHTILVA